MKMNWCRDRDIHLESIVPSTLIGMCHVDTICLILMVHGISQDLMTIKSHFHDINDIENKNKV